MFPKTIAHPIRVLPIASLAFLLLAPTVARPQTAAPLTARQKAALQKACANGTLSADECAAKGVTPGSAAAPAEAGAGRPYKDPNGRYSLIIPPGWNSSTNNGDLSMTSGTSWVQVVTSTADNADAAANTQANNFHTAFSTFNILNHGASKIAGHDAWGMNFDAVSVKGGGHLSVLFISQSAGNNHFLTIVSCTPVDQAPTFNDAVIKMANTVQF
jgi:hypothetical protein